MIERHESGRLVSISGLGSARNRRLESTFFMINVIFLLLLFFVVAGNLNLNIDVSPPRADAAQPMTASVRQLVIDAKGRLRFDGADVDLAALPAVLKGKGRIAELSITADAGIDAVLVAQVLGALSGLDLDHVTLLTLGRADGAPAGGSGG
jgi:biopolymer transport protein ExbD